MRKQGIVKRFGLMVSLGWGNRGCCSIRNERKFHIIGFLLLWVSAFAPCFLLAQARVQSADSAIPAHAKEYAGDKVCERCHAEIYRSYQETAMAHASGPAIGNLIPGEFTHALSNVRYRVYEQGGRAWLSFDRDGSDAIHGKRELLYFIGSGKRGRTYIFADGGFYFEAPVNWYAQKAAWDMTPAYQDARRIPLNLPLASSCLSCHTSDPQSPAPGTENEYREPLISQVGIGCERCHGPGAAHAESRGAIVNPAKLPPVRCDSVCMQCHLEGNVAIRQPGRDLSQFRVGDDLQDYVHYFVLTGAERDFRAASQFEALYRSKCQQKSGESFSCITCHDPHYSPAPSEKVAYYRAKCINCHGASFAAKHHKKNPDCVSCHMPRIQSSDVAHTQATDHRILRYPKAPTEIDQNLKEPELKPFSPTSAIPDDRDLALAWQSLAEGGMEAALSQAQRFLPKALAEKPDDPELLTAMGYLEAKHGKIQQARSLYERALQNDPFADVAATNLGVIAAQSGDLAEAIRLWKPVFAREPARSASGMDLAMVLCAQGDTAGARATVKRILEFNPDYPPARKLERDLNVIPPGCNLR
jgi:Tetratricopeptide repeat/Doubled CXXCH motif (Paired_CXXCH_1)/Cytochrome c554 and c-prime